MRLVTYMCQQHIHVNSTHYWEGATIASRDDQLKDVLAGFGIARDTSDHALELDAILQAWRRRVQKRELGQMALKELNLPLDLPKLDVLIAIWAPSVEFNDDREGETMVATIAARLGTVTCRRERELGSCGMDRGWSAFPHLHAGQMVGRCPARQGHEALAPRL